MNQFVVLVKIRDGLSFFFIGCFSLRKPPVVKKPAGPSKLGKQLPLTFCWVKAIFKSFLQKHADMLNLAYEKVNGFLTWKNMCFCNACTLSLLTKYRRNV